MNFSHLGMTTETEMPDEMWVEATRVWVTDFRTHPFRVEWLRYAPDSPVTGPVHDRPHIAFDVEDLEAAAAGMKVLLEPFFVSETLRVGFYEASDGTVVEFAEDRPR
jgi:hypothetical protein